MFLLFSSQRRYFPHPSMPSSRCYWSLDNINSRASEKTPVSWHLPLLIIAVWNDLRTWRHQSTLPDINSYPLLLQQALLEQRRIGWKQFMEGLLTKSWGTYMTVYYKTTRSLRKGSTWTKRLMKYNWEAVFSIWDNRNKQLHHTLPNK